jgi:single-stranded DNA-binding protein
MNKCIFLGRLTSPPEVYIDENNNTPVIDFELEIEEFRRDSKGEKRRMLTYLLFQAWDTAALTIEKWANEDSLMSIESTARIDDDGNTYFRVTSFKII